MLPKKISVKSKTTASETETISKSDSEEELTRNYNLCKNNRLVHPVGQEMNKKDYQFYALLQGFRLNPEKDDDNLHWDTCEVFLPKISTDVSEVRLIWVSYREESTSLEIYHKHMQSDRLFLFRQQLDSFEITMFIFLSSVN